MQASLSPSSRAHYERAWKKLVLFQNTLGLASRLPVSVSMLLLFIANLHANGAAPASIVSAVAYFHKINGFPDPSHCFLVAKVLAGARNLGAVPDVRLPVTLLVLTRLVRALPRVISSHYKCLMLRVMMVLAFKAYLRGGEMVPRSKGVVSGCLHVSDVFLSGDLMSVSFRRFKHSTAQGPQFILVKSECTEGSGHPYTGRVSCVNSCRLGAVCRLLCLRFRMARRYCVGNLMQH